MRTSFRHVGINCSIIITERYLYTNLFLDI